MSFKQNKAELYSAIVWILAGISLVIYCVLGLLNTAIPGVEELVAFLATVDGKYIFAAALISVFIEGLYFVGSFFPGSTLVVILAILSQLSGTAVFIGTMTAVFIGWCLAGVINILLARAYCLKVAGLQVKDSFEIKDRAWTTWLPSFRANYEVAQITSGGSAKKVFFSSVRVKLWASIVLGICSYIFPFFIDIEEVSNEEGYVSVVIIALISFVVGFANLKRLHKGQN